MEKQVKFSMTKLKLQFGYDTTDRKNLIEKLSNEFIQSKKPLTEENVLHFLDTKKSDPVLDLIKNRENGTGRHFQCFCTDFAKKVYAKQQNQKSEQKQIKA